jgi:hypothetical protein
MKGYKIVRKINGKLFSAHAGQKYNNFGPQVRYKRDEVAVNPKGFTGLAVYLDGEKGLKEAKLHIESAKRYDCGEGLQVHRCDYVPSHIEGRYIRDNYVNFATTAFSVTLGKKVI